MKKAWGIPLVLLMVMVSALTACGGTPGERAAEPEYTFKLATAIAYEGSPHTLYCESFMKYVDEYSNGRIKIDFYPAGQLGNEKEIFEGVTMGSVDFYFGGTPILSYWTEAFYDFDLPCIFRSVKEAYAVLDSDYMAPKTAILEALGTTPFIYTVNAPDVLVSNKPVYKPQDLAGFTIRVQETPVLSDMYIALDVNPVTVPFSEAFTLLQNGSVDALTMPSAVHFSNKYYTVAEYLILCNMFYTPNFLVGSTSTLSALSDEDREIIRRAAVDGVTAARPQAEALNADCIAKMLGEGIKLCELNLDADWYDYVEEKCWAAAVASGKTKKETIEQIRKIASAAK